MENSLRELLEEDEKLLWFGRPEPFETLDKTNKKSIVIGLVIKVLVIIGCLALYAQSVTTTGDFKPVVPGMVFAVGAYAIASPFLIARRLRKSTLYGLTDRRVLRTGANSESVPYERIKSAVLRRDEDGHTTLLCGPRTRNLKPRSWRGEADAAFINGPDDPEALRVILYNIPMDKKLQAVLGQYLHVQ